MRTVTREQLYAAVPPLAALLVGVGVVTDAQGAAIAAVAVEAITLGFACYYAAKQKAPLTRTVLYGFLAAVAGVATVFGLVSTELAPLLVAAGMGVLGILVAESNTSSTVASVPVYPGEYSALDRADGLGADGIPDDDPQRKA